MKSDFRNKLTDNMCLRVMSLESGSTHYLTVIFSAGECLKSGCTCLDYAREGAVFICSCGGGGPDCVA